MKILLAFFIAALCVACVNLRGQDASELTLVYTGNLDGELEPCGCSEGGNKGGIKRQVTQLDELRQRDPHLLLISSGGLITSEIAQDKIKSEYILKGLAAQNFDAIGVQWQDLSFGTPLLVQSALPLVASNWQGDDFVAQRRIQRNGIEIAYFHWLDPATDPLRKKPGAKTPVTNSVEPMRQAIAQAKREGALTILGTTLTAKQVETLLPLTDLDIVLLKSKYEQFGEPQQIGSTLLLQPGSRGMRLGQIKLKLNGGAKIAQWQHEVFALPPEVADSPRMAQWYEEYNAKLKEDYQRGVEIKKLAAQETPYAGADVCQQCHANEYATWEQTKHAQAFYALQDVNKAFDPNCIGCHTVGFEKAGGFIEPTITPERLHVQCESCHGAAKVHVASKGAVGVVNRDWQPKQICAQCHVQKHSPDFVFEHYWPRIAHGRLAR